MVNIIVFAILALIIGAAVSYIVRAKKKGVKCIGCPEGCTCGSAAKADAPACGGSCGSCPGCAGHTQG